MLRSSARRWSPFLLTALAAPACRHTTPPQTVEAATPPANELAADGGDGSSNGRDTATLAASPVHLDQLGPLDRTQTAYTNPGEVPRLLLADGSRLPLEHTDVDASVRGHTAEVVVKQSFVNDQSSAVEVTYTFPLPENSAVHDMKMVVGQRVIESDVLRRADARRRFEDARRAGQTAALLEQERPNIFTQSVTNVPPGETVDVEIRYLQTLTQDAGEVEFVFPMVVGPRFVPGAPDGRGGTTSVPDAARISPPVIGEGTRTGSDVSLRIAAEVGHAVRGLDAPTHRITTNHTARGFSAALSDAETIPNRDFVLRWTVAESKPTASLFLGPPDRGGHGHFALVINPPALDVDALVGHREMIFVVDRSGSMSGVPLALAKQTLRAAMDRMRPVDTFDVIGFASANQRLFSAPRPANVHNLVLAERFIDGMRAGGGTMLGDAVNVALSPSLTEGRHRYVVFLTDGYVGNEEQIMTKASALVRRAARRDERARVFGVGIGSSPNDHLIDGLSRAGDGLPLRVSNREHPGRVVEQWTRLVDHPVLDDVDVDWGGLRVEELFPGDVSGLFASHPLVMRGRYSGGVTGTPTITAKASVGGETVRLPITVLQSKESDDTLGALWAREKIDDVTAALWDGVIDHGEAEDTITRLGLDFRLATQYTSFVAVDRSRRVGRGDPNRITQPVHAPEDVDPTSAGANVAAAVYSVDGANISLEQSKNLPVGSNTSRDFTTVVDVAPSASRDAAGISLAGTTGIERKLVVESVSPTTMGTVGASLSQELMRTITIGHKTSWEPNAILTIKRVAGPRGTKHADLLKAVRRDAIKFEACYEQQVGEPGREQLEFRLEFDARGKLLRVERLSGDLGSTSANRCIEAVLRGIEFPELPATASAIELRFSLYMR